MLADFYIIGAMKSATSTLAAQLGAQSGVFMTTPKEPNFFSDDKIFAQGMDWYEHLFDDAPDGALRGEASTHYTKWPTHPLAPERVKAATPNAKFIYIIRDPLKRAISHYRHEWTQGLVAGSPDQAARTMPELWQYSCYFDQLRRWLVHFGPEQFLLLTTEGLKEDPEGSLARALEFLGADGAWDHALGNSNQSAERWRRLPLQSVIVDNPIARALRRSLIPKAVREKVRQSRQPPMAADFTDEAKSYLCEKIDPDMKKLGELVGLPLSVGTYGSHAATDAFDIRNPAVAVSDAES